MAEDLVGRLRNHSVGFKYDGPDGLLAIIAKFDHLEKLTNDAADLIEQQAASLAALHEQARRDREYSSSQSGEHAKLVNRVLAAESRAEQAERVFTDLCEEIGCKPDNEAALEAVAALKRALAEAVEVMKPFASDDLGDCTDCVDNDDKPYQSQWFADSLTAARAFVAQHGSDSREGK